MESVQSVNKICCTKTCDADVSAIRTLERKPIITVQNVRKTYRNSGEEALKGLTFSVLSGEFFGLLGPNSAGKTTLISILCGLLKITGGEVNVSEVDVKMHPEKMRQFIGLIPQEIALYPELTVIENIKYFGKMHGLNGKLLEERIASGIKAVQLEKHAHKRVKNCSGGIKRRTNLICGLVHMPSIIFLDEPTLGVDVQSRGLIFKYLEEQNKSGTTIIYTTHYMKEAEELCDKILIIDHGKILKNDSPQALIKSTKDCGNLGDVFLKLTGKELRD